MEIMIIGPFPPPITGMTMANNMLYENLQKMHWVNIINTQSKKSLDQFKNSILQKIIRSCIFFLKTFYLF